MGSWFEKDGSFYNTSPFFEAGTARWGLGVNESPRVRRGRQIKLPGVERPWENPAGWGCRLCKDLGC